MKKAFILLNVILVCYCGQSQSSRIKDYKDSVRLAKTDTSKAKFLYILSYYYLTSKPDSALYYAQLSHILSTEIGFEKGISNALKQKASALNKLGNYAKSLETYIEQLRIVEKRKDPYDIGSTYLSIALLYNNQKDTRQALRYAYKADSIAKTIIVQEPGFHLYTTLEVGDVYSNDNQLDSALHYTLLCYDESVRLKNDLITGSALNNIGNIYMKSGDYANALKYFRLSIPILDSVQDSNTLAECYFGMARCFDSTGAPDSALHYAMRSYKLASENGFLSHAVNSSRFIYSLYKEQHNVDSAFAFQEIYVDLKDSFDNADKIRQVQNLTINEQLHQDQMAFELLQQAKERRVKLELLFVGMFIPILFLVTAFISGRRVHRKLVQVLGIFSVLFLFEYITLLLHPWVMEKTGHSPIYEILIFVAIAAVISPAHHRIETWLVSLLKKRHQLILTRAMQLKAAREAALKAKLAAEMKAKEAEADKKNHPA